VLAAAAAPVQAQRDPTRPPGVAATAPAVGEGPRRVAEPPPPELPALRQLLVVDGRRYVVAGSRLVGEGGRLGPWQVERIEDAAVVLRLRQQQHRVSLHPQVSKRPVAAGPVPPALALPAGPVTQVHKAAATPSASAHLQPAPPP
jgi:hypothetical protein